ncbi:hydrogenase maturation protein HypF [Gammaproteobacteria bacterium]
MLCGDCLGEYENVLNRRFHAEPIACPVCGPHLQFVSSNVMRDDDDGALAATVTALRDGQIVAVKGIGGYHLLCDATNDTAVVMLRARKQRPTKPLAVMFRNLDMLHRMVYSTQELDEFLATPQRPIVLLPKRRDAPLSTDIAPGLVEIGCLLPYSPLHDLLLHDFGGPLVATSGNLSGEPVLTNNTEAEHRLARITNLFLHHNRPIIRPADDSVYRVIAGKPRPLRLGRGSAPRELELPTPLPAPVLALGSHMKNTICLAWDRRAIIAPHIGELDSVRSLDMLGQVAADLQRLYQVQATKLIVDHHPGYGSRHYARSSNLPLAKVWHHHAHASALAWEFPTILEWIVFAWDGVGFGNDKTLWGGEAFTGSPGHWRRMASFRTFALPGGDKVGRELWRSAAGLLWEIGQSVPFAPELLHQAWLQGINCSKSSAVGRLFDAATMLCGIGNRSSFEGEGPMHLEAVATEGQAIKLPLQCDPDGIWRSDWAPLLPMLTDNTRSVGERAASFHHSLAGALVEQALQLSACTAIRAVGLTGGVFQNRRLTEIAVQQLEAAGFSVHLPQCIPANDAGLSFGQVIEFLFETT